MDICICIEEDNNGTRIFKISLLARKINKSQRRVQWSLTFFACSVNQHIIIILGILFVHAHILEL